MIFDYSTAFNRNTGFVSAEGQDSLRYAQVAIAGLGGTGGAQAHALARMGVGNFTLADPDTFELVNFNRQIGATIPNIGRPKVDVAEETIKSINPESRVKVFRDGITPDNVYAFLEGVRLVVDSLDFYCFKERMMLYSAARTKGVWVLTSPPLGFGFSMLAFDPHGLSFEDYFGMHSGMDSHELLVRFVAGLSPRHFMMKYLKLENVKGHKSPSVGAAPFMVAGATATEVTRMIIDCRYPRPAPHIYQFDALRHKFWKGKYNQKSLFQRCRRKVLSAVLKDQ